MGMTIDEAIIDIKDNIKPVVGGISLDMAIETMRRYQKIEEIVKNTQYLCSYGSAFIDIREVIKDGNDD